MSKWLNVFLFIYIYTLTFMVKGLPVILFQRRFKYGNYSKQGDNIVTVIWNTCLRHENVW